MLHIQFLVLHVEPVDIRAYHGGIKDLPVVVYGKPVTVRESIGEGLQVCSKDIFYLQGSLLPCRGL